MSASILERPDQNVASRLAEKGELRDFIKRAEHVASVAERFAAAVDSEGRFPAEAFAAIREQRLLGMMISTELGGGGARAADVADVCAILGAACSSTGMIFAMHQVKVACLVRHHQNNEWQLQFQRDVAKHEWLLASSTTEGNNGGDIRSSEAPVQIEGSRLSLVRDASCISYGADADAIVTTARRAGAASSADQVLLAFKKSDYTLEPTRTWDTLGMRGTCSVGYLLRAQGVVEQMLAEPYERIHNQTMAPYAHCLERDLAGRRLGRFPARARFRPPRLAQFGRPHASGRGASDARARHAGDAARRHSGGPDDFRAPRGRTGGLTAMHAQLALNFLKVEASELAASSVISAMRACGLSGYRNDTEFTMGRYLRDILSAPIMINNDRILANAEAAVLMSEPPAWLSA